jgi:hypothetical protein
MKVLAIGFAVHCQGIKICKNCSANTTLWWTFFSTQDAIFIQIGTNIKRVFYFEKITSKLCSRNYRIHADPSIGLRECTLDIRSQSKSISTYKDHDHLLSDDEVRTPPCYKYIVFTLSSFHLYLIHMNIHKTLNDQWTTNNQCSECQQ